MIRYIMAMDQGTTSSRAIIFDKAGVIISTAQKEFTQLFPQPGWVEHDPAEIWSSQIGVATEAMAKVGLEGGNIAAIGITNQRETTLVWDRETGKPVYNAIVWQDRRTAAFCDDLKAAGKETLVREKTGLVIDAYFSGTKIRWILDNVPGARERANEGKLAFGTVDSWLIWNLTHGAVHATDITNASRTMLFNIHTQAWDDELLAMLDIPASMLPEVKQSSEVCGETASGIFAVQIPIAGVAGDQHAALFGQMCTAPGMVKNTYGTGCFMLMNIGDTPIISKNNLLTTVAWKVNGQVQYALEGSIFIAGAIVQWLRDGLGIIRASSEVEALAASVEQNDGVYLVPAFAGLGAPHWDQHARGTLVGMTRGTNTAHIARAALESIAYQTMEVLKAMEADANISIKELRVDGGATGNNLLMQFQADILQTKVVRPGITETTALGAAYLAGLATGYWQNLEEIASQWKMEKCFSPKLEQEQRQQWINGWNRAVNAAKAWAHQ
ncbi:glycerol kinase GlpK [Chitinophaga ginsengisegetis]|uniref:glycerol kinase GlpK n=1 Tax=Chitinophaga ginsengisegetis TaxID=393003 RepID=UPI000DB92765|nr:glycerol kinase GlpK [Chitinophaga ginsengisegetis]MDR6569819.1 glycerol kinase [Chitinophaga ginsengisegetis]MDR6649552.1 glycerol kinase [Chitinophaga ginsengisegetis]MDR6655902.1 glycerol kinase [Chitinophaga ginsengisegetis]